MSLNPRGGFRSAATAAITASALVVCLAPNAVAQTGTTVEFSVSNMTDFHGHIEQSVEDDGSVTQAGAAAIAAKVDQLRAAENISRHFHTTSGDNVGGSAFNSAILDDQPTLDVLTAMGVDVSAAGNHEFDEGYDDLIGRITDESDYSILGANVNVEDDRETLDPYEIHTVEGENGQSVDVAFIGAVTANTANKVAPSAVEGISFDNPWDVTNRIADELSDGDDANGEADVVIALFHEGATDPSAFSDNVDVVFAGDTHLVQEPTGSNPVALQAGEYGTHLANVNFVVDTTTGEVSVEPELIDAEKIAAAGANEDVQAIVDAAVAEAEEAGGVVVAETEHTFTRGARGDQGPGSNRGVESTLNNLIAEAQRAYMEDFTGVEMDLGLMNAGGVRADLAAGEITYADAFEVQPFGNPLMYGTLTGADILATLEQQWKDPAAERPRLALGVSDNFSYTYDPTAAQGERIIQATINGESLDPAAEYNVAASSFLFEGGDGFDALTNATNQSNVGVMDVAAFTEYLGDTENLEPRWAQGAIGISTPDSLTPGETVTIELESLAYTVNPTATEVTVQIGEETVTAPIDTTVIDEGYGSTGTASVEITVPEDFVGDASDILVSTNAVAPEAPEEPEVPGEPADNPGSIEGSSEAGPLAAVVAAIAGIAAALGLANLFAGGQLLADAQANIQREIDRFLGQF